MPPIRSYMCSSCQYEFDRIEGYESADVIDCERCEGSECAHRVPTSFGGYNMNSGGSSTRPRGVYKSKNKFNFPTPKGDN